MAQLNIPIEQLRSMIGLQVSYNHVICRVVEILEDVPALVLEDLEHRQKIQPDQHGEAHRIVPKTYTVNVLSPDRTEFSNAFLAMDANE